MPNVPEKGGYSDAVIENYEDLLWDEQVFWWTFWSGKILTRSIF